MRRFRYAFSLAVAIICVTTVAMVAFGRISAATLDGTVAMGAVEPAATEPSVQPLVDSSSIYEKLAAEDEEWRQRHARTVTLSELRQRGDGRRTPRQALDDRVYLHVRNGDRKRAIVELEQWVKTNPRDESALLSLARLLKDEGRTRDAAARYRQILALHEK